MALVIITVLGIIFGVIGIFTTNEVQLKVLGTICALGNLIVLCVYLLQ